MVPVALATTLEYVIRTRDDVRLRWLQSVILGWLAACDWTFITLGISLTLFRLLSPLPRQYERGRLTGFVRMMLQIWLLPGLVCLAFVANLYFNGQLDDLISRAVLRVGMDDKMEGGMRLSFWFVYRRVFIETLGNTQVWIHASALLQPVLLRAQSPRPGRRHLLHRGAHALPLCRAAAERRLDARLPVDEILRAALPRGLRHHPLQGHLEPVGQSALRRLRPHGLPVGLLPDPLPHRLGGLVPAAPARHPGAGRVAQGTRDLRRGLSQRQPRDRRQSAGAGGDLLQARLVVADGRRPAGVPGQAAGRGPGCASSRSSTTAPASMLQRPRHCRTAATCTRSIA